MLLASPEQPAAGIEFQPHGLISIPVPRALISPPIAEAMQPQEPEIVYCTDPESEIWKAAERLEADVFIEKGYVETAEELGQEYLPYRDASTMAVLMLGEDIEDIIGMTRLIRYEDKSGFKTVDDIVKGRLEVVDEGWSLLMSLNFRKTAEVGTIALKPEYRSMRGLKHVAQLYSAIFKFADMHGLTDLIASFDAAYFGGFRKRFSPAVTPLGPATDYMGSATIPAQINMSQVNPRVFS